jgi:hypothetical protein
MKIFLLVFYILSIGVGTSLGFGLTGPILKPVPESYIVFLIGCGLIGLGTLGRQFTRKFR